MVRERCAGEVVQLTDNHSARKPAIGKAVIVIPSVMPSLNQQLRMHWADRMRLKDKCAEDIDNALKASGYKVTEMIRPSRRKVTIISYRKRLLDEDNNVGATKPLLDAVKDMGLIWDDSPKFCDLVTRQEKAGDVRTEIQIEVMKGEKDDK